MLVRVLVGALFMALFAGEAFLFFLGSIHGPVVLLPLGLLLGMGSSVCVWYLLLANSHSGPVHRALLAGVVLIVVPTSVLILGGF